MMGRGHESWHPSPEFYYERGGGPMLDMGPYYVTALIHLLGGVRRVTGSARISFPTRTITSQPKFGKVVTVETPTHIVGIMDFASGTIGEITTSFDVMHASLPPITVFGSEGTLAVPDPNGFGGPVRVRRKGDEEWSAIPLAHGFAENSRGLGVLDMAYAIRKGTPHRASGALAFHALDVMHAFTDASEAGRHIDIQSAVPRPEAMAPDLYGDETN
jgi:predicted dehydrogenase